MNPAIETSPADANGPVHHHHHRRERQPVDVIARNFAALPEHQREALLWLHAYANTHELTTAAMGALIDYDKSTISRLYAAELTYRGDLDAVTDAIKEARAKLELEEKAGSRRLPFIECALSRHLWKLCDLTRDYERIAFVYGESQIGKSTNLKEKARREAGAVFYWEMPVGGALHNFLGNAAETFGMSPQTKSSELRRRVIAAVRPPERGRPVLVIVDQMHRCFSDAKGHLLAKLSRAQLHTLDFLIELFDDSRKGIVLAGTEVFREGIEQLVHAKFFAQLRRRGLNEEGFPLPARPSEGDLNAFARHYGLKPAEGAARDLQQRIVAASGLGVWLTRLSMGAHAAKKARTPLAWAHVLAADDFLAAAARGKLRLETEAPARAA